MSKKILFVSLLFIILFSNFTNIYGQPNILCDAAILIDADTGTILFEKNSDTKMYPASLTKVLTGIIAIEMGNLDDIIVVDDKTPYEIDGSHIALEPGEKLTLNDLLYGLLIASANDVASVIAKHYGGSIDGFAQIMNTKAKELGAVNTNFNNPHGLHDSNHYSTAEDLSIIASYAMKNEVFREIVKTKSYKINSTNKKDETRYINATNKLLYATGYGNQIKINGKWVDSKYEGAAGVKTGYTPEAGSCLISYVEKNDMRLITVVLKGNVWNVYTDTHNLLNYGFENFEPLLLINKNEFVQNLEVKDGTSKFISAISQNNLKVIVKKDQRKNITKKVSYSNISLPLKKDDIIGKIEYTLNNNTLGIVNLISPISVEKSSYLEFIENIYNMPLILKILLSLFILIILLRIYYKTKRSINRKIRQKRRYKQKKERIY